MKELKGLIPAVIAPLKEDRSLDRGLFEKQVAYLADSGVDGFFINGTTGDGPLLTNQERLETLRIAKEVSGGRQFLCAASIHPSTEQVLDEIRDFEPLEPDFIVAVAPFYYSVSQKAIIEHFKAIIGATDIPVIVYNIPQCTHNKILYETFLELAELKGVAGIKDSSGDFITFSRWLYSSVVQKTSVVQGEDYLDAPSLNAGAKGLVSGLCNVWVKPYVGMMHASLRGDWTEVNKKQTEIDKLYEIIGTVDGKTLSAIKAGAALMGRSTKWLKIKGDELTKEEIGKVENILKQLNLE